MLDLKHKAPGPPRAKSEEDALQRALKFLSYRSRSQAEVRNKLAQLGYSHLITDRTLEKLGALGYINDEAFARSWAQARVESRGYGAKRIEHELKSKGIGPILTRQVIREACDWQSEKDNAKRLLERNFRDETLSDPKILRRATALLVRRGFSSEIVFELLRHHGEED